MTTNRRAGNPAETPKEQLQEPVNSADGTNRGDTRIDSLEGILRQLVTLRAASATDDQLAQLVRMVDSATWSAPVPMTILVDGTVLRGVLVPSEVSASFLDDALRRSAYKAVAELESETNETLSANENGGEETESRALVFQQARAFLKRILRRPFGASQVRMRQRNANALLALNKWHETRARDTGLTALDFPGSYTDPTSAARDVVGYTTGQRALTLADVNISTAGEWLAVPGPVRVSIGRIGAWTVDL